MGYKFREVENAEEDEIIQLESDINFTKDWFFMSFRNELHAILSKKVKGLTEDLGMWVFEEHFLNLNIPNTAPGCHICLTGSWAYVPGKPMYTSTNEFRPQSQKICYQKKQTVISKMLKSAPHEICLCFVWEYSPGEKTGPFRCTSKICKILSDWTSHGVSKVLTGILFEAYSKS